MSAYMGSTRGSGVLSSACGVLEMSVVSCVGGVCVCVWHRVLGYRGLGLGFTNPGGKWDMCVFWLRWCGGVGWRLGPGFGRVGWY